MIEVPSLDSVAAAALAVGALFLVRYFLIMRRIWKASGHRPSFQFGDYFRATTRGAYGPDLEPERRYAARQLVLGIVLTLAGLGLFAALFVAAMTLRLQG